MQDGCKPATTESDTPLGSRPAQMLLKTAAGLVNGQRDGAACGYVLTACCGVGYAVNRHRTVMNLGDKVPQVANCAFVAPSASIIGSVSVGKGASIWYGSILRGTLPHPSAPFPARPSTTQPAFTGRDVVRLALWGSGACVGRTTRSAQRDHPQNPSSHMSLSESVSSPGGPHTNTAYSPSAEQRMASC
jgi:hypothetical protein